MKKIILATLALLAGFGPAAGNAAAQNRVPKHKMIKALIVTGQDDSHWWQGGSDALALTLAESHGFEVDMATTPEKGGDMNSFTPHFASYDVVVLNYNGEPWSAKTRKAFERYVNGGGGVVVVHSSIIPMEDWKPYNEMTGLGAWNGRDEKSGPWVYWQDGAMVHDNSPGEAGFHTLQHPFTVVHRAPNHPILKGLPPVWLHFKDELYAKTRGPAHNMEVLATAWDDPAGGGSGRHEPVMWTVAYGRGRVFVTTMGHAGNDPELRYSMECAGFQETLLRGAEWAATGVVTRPVTADLPTEWATALRPDFRVESKMVEGRLAPVRVTWKPRALTIVNDGEEPLPAGWQLWYNGPTSRMARPEDSPIQMVSNGSLAKIYTTQHYRPLLHGETLEIPLSNSDHFSKNMDAPEGMFIVMPGGEIIPIEARFDPVPTPNNGRAMYDRNLDAARWPLSQTDILPLPKSVTPGEAETTIEPLIALEYPGLMASEAGFLTEYLTDIWGATVVLAPGYGEKPLRNATLMRLVNNPQLFSEPRPEGYRIEISKGTITITGAGRPGLFYGIQTLFSIIKNQPLPVTLADATITDWPDFPFRGQHLDISRNYISLDNVMHLIDVFAAYKLNVLHWHFSDDEGWRLEIPGLPELTEIGARRGFTPTETDMLVPAYNGGADPAQGTGSGYVTRAEFIEMLKYAARRHVKIIPEIESPGHARAARVAMNARYRKYIATDPARAREYLLDDFDDRSVYNSAQNYGDNVMNVALPSTYRFMEKVIDEIDAMYDEAGVELDIVHIGGDEVPHGSWGGSPLAHRFMVENNIPDIVALGEYYILRVNELLEKRGIKMTGWQELVEGRSEAFRLAVKNNLGYVNVWSTNGRQAEIPYRLANQGYPVVLSNVGNYYMDLAYSNHPDERGLSWGGFVDEQRALSMQPWDIYNSVRRDDAGREVDNSRAGDGREKLTDEGMRNIVGLQGQLWGETLRSFDGAAYMLFPKMLGLVERAWNSNPSWSDREEFLRDYSRFHAIAAEREMPWLARQGLNFRVSPPGIYIENGLLWANSQIRGAEIRYTTDGSIPTAESELWTRAVSCNANTVIARTFYLGRGSVCSRFDNPDAPGIRTE
jgi:hexosaminidase